MSLFVRSVYAASALSVGVVLLLYRSHPFRRLPSASVFLAFGAGMVSVVGVALFRAIIGWDPVLSSTGAFLGAAAIEEAFKLLALLVAVWRLRYPYVIEPYDIVLLFGILGAGFGVYEDFSYIFSGSYPAWIEGDVIRFRTVFSSLMMARSLPGHVLFNALAGAVLARARFPAGRRRQAVWIGAAFALAVCLHALYNVIAVYGSWPALLAYSVALVGVLIGVRRVIASGSPFAALVRRIEQADETAPWTYERSPMEILFAEGFSWPARARGGLFQVYPIVLSLAVLFPVLFVVVYFMQRIVTWPFS